MRITKATPKGIEYACLHFHYAKKVPSIIYGFNIYNDENEWCGIIGYGQGASPNLSKNLDLDNGEFLELVRVALNGKQNCTSECVSATLREIHRINPIIKLIVSYADMDQNHFGTIYQATNFIYLGESVTNYVDGFRVNGKFIKFRSESNKGSCSIENLKKRYGEDAIIEKKYSKGKRKYIYCFDKKLRKKFMKIAKPYPKKEMILNGESRELDPE